jgi:class 3 adenylate cyclase
VQSEVSAQHGFIAELAATTALVVFRGDGALNRAVDAALALREQLREGFSDSAREAWQPRDFRAGIDAGTIAVGSTLVPGLGRVEHLLFGPAVARARSLRDAAIAEEILVAKGSESLLSEYRQGVRDELSVVGAVSVQFKGRSSASHSSCTEDGSGDVTCPIRLANDGPSG